MATDYKMCNIHTVAWLSVVAVIILVGWIGYSHFEAASYNKITGADVSTWDAMFLTFAVQSGPPAEDRLRPREPDSADKPQGVNGQPVTGQSQEGTREWKPDKAPARIVVRSEEELACGIGNYMPPITDLGLEIAVPQGWTWLPRREDYVVRFVKEGNRDNDLPRILVEVRDSQFMDLRRVTEDNVDEFVDKIKPLLPADEVVPGSITPAVLSGKGFPRYSLSGIEGKANVQREFLETVAGDRRYVVCLEVFKGMLYDVDRDALYAVGMSMTFDTQDGSTVAGESQAAPSQTSPED